VAEGRAASGGAGFESGAKETFFPGAAGVVSGSSIASLVSSLEENIGNGSGN